MLLPEVSQWTFERGGKSVQQRVSGRFVAVSLEALQQAAIEGLSIVRLSAWNVQEDLASHRLVEGGPTDAIMPQQSVWAVYPTRRFVPAKVRLFVEAFQTDPDVGVSAVTGPRCAARSRRSGAPAVQSRTAW